MFLIKYLCFEFFLVLQVESKNPFCQLSCGSNKNTACKREGCGPGRNCKSAYDGTKLNDEQRNMILEAHNEYRNKLASGGDTRGGNEAAANMNVLSYSKEIEYVAQCWTNNCKFGHDQCRTTSEFPTHVGQNIYYSSSTFSDADLKKAVEMWYEEIKSCTADVISSFAMTSAPIGHFTQLVWAETTFIGCGRTSYVDSTGQHVLLACNYGIGGNMLRSPIYLKGAACSKCSSNCNDKYTSLCGTIRPLEEDTWSSGRNVVSTKLLFIGLISYLLQLEF